MENLLPFDPRAIDLASLPKTIATRAFGSRDDPTLISYLESTTETFDERPFGILDAFVLANVSYLLLENTAAAKSEQPRNLNDLLTDLPAEVLSDLFWFNPLAADFADALCACPRSVGLCVSHVSHRFNTDDLTQFCALCLHVPDGSFYLSYRGTDSTITGWQEDFMMSILDPIPSQKEALDYAEDLIDHVRCTYPNAAIRLGGHSKGGNLALYAALYCEESLQDRITDAYSFDGPGFKNWQIESEEHARIARRCHKFIPVHSVFGGLFDDLVPTHIVTSNEHGLMQHMPFSWLIDGDDFIYESDAALLSRITKRTISRWIDGFTQEERMEFCSILFGVVDYACPTNHIEDLPAALVRKGPAIITQMASFDKEMRQLVFHVLGSYIAGFIESSAETILP